MEIYKKNLNHSISKGISLGEKELIIKDIAKIIAYSQWTIAIVYKDGTREIVGEIIIEK